MDIPKGTKIVCSGGHEVGRVLETIPTGAPITAEKIQIDIATTAELIDSRDGHACKTCQERVMMLRGARSRYTRRGDGSGHSPKAHG